MEAGIRKFAKFVGSKYYFTVRACKQGHIAFRYTDSGSCKKCCEIRMRSEKRKTYNHLYYKKHTNKIKKATLK